MLIEIRDLIKERKMLSLRDLSIHFKMDKSAIEPIVECLIQKGDIKKTLDQTCAGCRDNCPFAGEPMVLVEWCGSI